MEIRIDNVGNLEIPSEIAEQTKIDDKLSEILRILLNIQEQLSNSGIIKKDDSKTEDEFDIQKE